MPALVRAVRSALDVLPASVPEAAADAADAAPALNVQVRQNLVETREPGLYDCYHMLKLAHGRACQLRAAVLIESIPI